MTTPHQTWSFERFMSEALYHPEKGYYTRFISDVGRRGDFSTSATIHPAFAKAIATWAWKAAPWSKGRKHLIEVGAGNGELAAAVRKALPPWYRPLVKYHIVEISPRLQELQQKRLGRRATWHGSMAEALRAARGNAAIFSNEVPDAMPCAIFVKQSGAWKELCLTQTADGWEERLGDSPIESSSAIERLPIWPEGQRIEVAFSYRRWIKTWAAEWRRGLMLTIDYGDTVDHLYHRRPRGTLRAYFHHQRLEGRECYQRFGRQDLTVDVNFTDLINWGKELGWHAVELMNQREFLLTHLPSAGREPDPRLAFLLDEYGAGGAFRVLIQKPRPTQTNPPAD